MSTAKLTLIGLYNYDPTLFDNMVMPSGIDKDLLVDNILLRSGDFESLYGDPDFIKDAVGIWSRKWQRTFEKWQKALTVEYDPLYNYDRKEEWVTSEDEATATSGKSRDVGSTDAHSTSNDNVSAYNNNSLVPDKENVLSSGSNTVGNTEMENTSDRDRNEIRTGRAYGNIGVTTSQQMLQAELDVASWNLYEHITDIFLSEFIIPVF